ncbi:MAG: AsmA-like C-terminal domain-containing protein [Desulfobacteraceae bacterium]
MISKKIRAVLVPLFLLFLLLAACVILAHELIKRPGVQQYLMVELSEAVGYEVHAGHIELELWNKIGINAQDLRIKSREGASLLSASNIRIHLDGRALIRGRFVPTRLVLVEPELELALPASRAAEAGRHDQRILGVLAAFSSLGVEKGRVVLKGVPFDLGNANVDLLRTARDPLAFTLSANVKVAYKDRTIPLSVSGKVAQKTGQDFSGEIAVHVNGIPLPLLPWPRDLPFKGGEAEIQLKATGSIKDGIDVHGVLNADGVDFLIIDEGDQKRFSLDRLSIPFDARYSASVVAVPKFQVNAQGFSLDGVAGIDFTNVSNPGISLKITSPFMPLGVFKRIFPSSLLPAWLEARLFPCFSEGRVRVDDFSLKGTLHEIEDLDLYENAKALSLKLTCQGLTAFKGDDVLPMQDVSGRVRVQNGILQVTGVEAGFGASHIEEGRLTVDTVYSDAPAYEAFISGSFEIQDLLREQGLDFIPPEISRILDGWGAPTRLQTGAVSGRMDARVGVVYQDGWNFPRISTGAFQFKACNLDMKELIFPVTLETGNLQINGKGRPTFSATGRWGGSHIKASGSMGESWRTGRVQMELQADLEGLLHRFYPSAAETVHAANLVPAQLVLAREEEKWSFQGQLHPQGVFMESDEIKASPFDHTETLSFDGRFIPGKEVVLHSLKFTPRSEDRESDSQAVIALSGTYGIEKDSGVDIKIKTRDLNLQDLRVTFKNRDISAQGSFSCDARAQTSGSEASAPAVTGIIQGNQISFQAGGLPAPITDMDFKIQCEGQACHVDFLNMKMGSNGCRVEGELHGWRPLQGDLSLASDHLHLSELIPEHLFSRMKKGISATPKGFMQDARIGVKLDVQKADWKEVDFGPVEALCAIRGGNLYVNQAEIGLPYGRTRFKGHLKRGKNPQAAVSTYVNLTRIPIKRLPQVLTPVKEYMEGDLSLEALVYLQGSDAEAWLSSLTGGANILIEKGVIKRSNIFIKILDFLSIKGLFTRDKDEDGSSGKGLKFDKIEGPVDLENGIAQVEQMRLRGPVLNAAGRGKVDLFQKTVDGEVGVEPLGTLDLVISHLPIVGHLLTGDKKALYVDYFKVEGPLSDPDVQYIPFKGLGSGTVGFIKRLFLSPGRLYKNISDKKRDFERRGLPLPDNLQPEKDMGP